MTITLRDLLARKGDPLQLEPLTGELGLDRPIVDPEVASPGLALAGYTHRFMPRRLHVLGETEITYLKELTAEERRDRLGKFFGFDLPVVFVTKAQDVPLELLDLARVRGVPLLRTRLKTAEFYKRIKPIMDDVATLGERSRVGRGAPRVTAGGDGSGSAPAPSRRRRPVPPA